MEHTSPRKLSSWRAAAALVPGLVLGVYYLVSTGPLPQPLGYHDFVDTRVLMGIPNAGDVLSNLAFVVVGAAGLWSLSRQELTSRCFIERRERRLFQWLYLGVLLTGFGSGWYHLEPNNDSLVWDRLPMTIGFMSMFAIMLAERVNMSLGAAMFGPLLAAGVASVLVWIWTEHAGRGDLRWYLLVQFYPMLTTALMLVFLPTPYTHGNDYWGLFLLYAAAKVAELLDREIYQLTHGLLSGHSVKHLFAGAGAAWLLRMLWLRRPRSLSPGL